MKYFIFLFSLVFLLACEKEYFPDASAYRDKSLFGTWIRLGQLNNENPSVDIFYNNGYCGASTSYSNAQSNNKIAYQGLYGVWYNELADSTKGFQYNRIHSQNRFRNGIWKRTEEYYFKKDTLFLRELGNNKSDTLIRYKYQLIYDKTKYTGLDSINR